MQKLGSWGTVWIVAGAFLVSGAAALGSSAPAHAEACPNDAVRVGLSLQLPDCRAYELVTPSSSNGRLFGDIGSGEEFDLFPTELASPLSESLIFSTEGSSLEDPPGGGGRVNKLDLYQALRSSSGWQVVRHISPSPTESTIPLMGGLSADHSYVFTHVGPTGNVSGNFGTLYKGKDADYIGNSAGQFELTGMGSLGTEPWAQGRYITPAGAHVIFTTGKLASGSQWCASAIQCEVKRLEPNAPPKGTGAIYDRSIGGSTHVVSLLPEEGIPLAGEDAAYLGTAKNATTVAFKIGTVLYARVANGSSSERTEKVTEEPSTFGGVSADGRYLFFVVSGDIHRFDTETTADISVNTSEDGQIVNVSADGSHVYFISYKRLDGSSGSEGQPNLYVWSGGSPRYIATVLPSDLNTTSGELIGIPSLTNWTNGVANPHDNHALEQGPALDSSRTTPGGDVLIFESRAQLTSFVNAGHTEIYWFDTDTEVEPLRCVSCNPMSTEAAGDARLQDLQSTGPATVLNNLSDDGGRVFFETDEALVSTDTDEINDVYEWQLAGSEGSANLSLISSGRSADYPKASEQSEDNLLLGITPDGSDVFFRSQDALTPDAGVGGAPAIYDARVGGGFSEPPMATGCDEEECHPFGGFLPTLGSAVSSTLRGNGNVVPAKVKKKRRHCGRRAKRHGRRRRHCPAPRPKGVQSSAASLSAAATAGVQAVTAKGEGETIPLRSGVTQSSATTLTGGEFEDFGIESIGAAESTTAAGGHPDLTTTLLLNRASKAKTKDIVVRLPAGLLGNPTLPERCATGDFLAGVCSVNSQIGISRTTLGEHSEPIILPVFNLAPPHPNREVARLGFLVQGLPVFIDVSVRTDSDYGVTATVHDAPSQFPLYGAEMTLWGDPSDPSHNKQRMTALEASQCKGTACKAENEERSSELPPIAFMTNPSACQQGKVDFSVTSYQLPGQVFNASAPMDPITGCQGLPFSPSFEAHPTSQKAGAPTGLKTVLRLPQSTDPSVPSTATMREAKVTLPEGMGISASAADGLDVCSVEQVHFHEELDAQCPDASKLGTAKIVSPVLPEPLEGAIYQRTPEPGHLFRLWLVSDQLGLHVKLPGEIKPDPNTGQLTAVFSDLPQVPVEEIDFDVWGGSRAPLKNPETCGTYSTSFFFAPHSDDPAVTGQTSMAIDEGCAAGFSPQLHGGATKPVAGAFSPFLLDLNREDGEQELAGFEATLPKGELAKLKGVPLCPDAQAGSDACPADSKIGSLMASVGAGPNPLWLPQPGKAPTAIYLAGPYQGAPYSTVSVVPAQAGPFDLGNVVVRSALEIDPETARVTVKANPLPKLVEGVPVLYRHLHVVVDRPNFTLNPTNCSQLAITSDVTSLQGTVAHPSERFQVDGCKKLKFAPKLALSLRGGTKRAEYPALKATLKARKGDANLGRVSVALPHSEFLAQEHIGTICTRVQFAAHKCPKRSVYGTAKAWTPLLDKPLKGPVYLRSSNHPLPDLVLDLKGQIEIAVPGRIDSKNGGIRTTFEAVPDAPITKFVLQMKGGKKSLLTNSQDICRGKHRAMVKMRAQNGRSLDAHPQLQARCAKSPGRK